MGSWKISRNSRTLGQSYIIGAEHGGGRAVSAAKPSPATAANISSIQTLETLKQGQGRHCLQRRGLLLTSVETIARMFSGVGRSEWNDCRLLSAPASSCKGNQWSQEGALTVIHLMQ